MNKKAITLQLNWIFILIAGGLILAFFFSVATKQKDLSEEKLSLSLVRSVDLVLEMAEASEGTSQVIPLPKKGVSLSCTNTCDCFFQTGNARSSFGNNVIFSENILDSPQAVIWSLPWKTPFRVANFLYVSNPETRKILVFEEDNTLAKDIENKLDKLIPDNIIFEKKQFGNIVDDGSRLTRIFLIGDVDIPKAGNFDSKLIKINPPLVSFFEKQGDEFKLKAGFKIPNDMTWIFAALFSADKDMFACGMKSALKRLHNIVDIFYGRAVLLNDKAASLGLVCAYPFDKLKVLNSTTMNVEVKDDQDLFATVTKINSLKGDLLQNNNALIQHSCPELF